MLMYLIMCKQFKFFIVLKNPIQNFKFTGGVLRGLTYITSTHIHIYTHIDTAQPRHQSFIYYRYKSIHMSVLTPLYTFYIF